MVLNWNIPAYIDSNLSFKSVEKDQYIQNISLYQFVQTIPS